MSFVSSTAPTSSWTVTTNGTNTIYLSSATTTTIPTTSLSVIDDTIVVNAATVHPANLDLVYDAQDRYTGAVGRVRVKKGYDVTIELPDGRTIHVDEDGNTSLKKEDIEALRTKYKVNTLYNGDTIIELENGLIVGQDVYGRFFVGDDLYGKPGEINAVAGKINKINLPDGSHIDIDINGVATLLKSGQRLHRAKPPGEMFNEFLNASDLLEKFITDMGARGVKQGEVLAIPVEVFINWLIINAAEKDNEESPIDDVDSQGHLARLAKPRCLHCGKFLSPERARLGVNFCSGSHMDAFIAKQGRPALAYAPGLPAPVIDVTPRRIPA